MSEPYATVGRHRIYQGDSIEVLKTIPDNTYGAIVTDPPYHLGDLRPQQRGYPQRNAEGEWDGDGRKRAESAGGFMGMKWDGGDIAFQAEFWRECYRVLKPGAYLVAFSGARTYHRMAVAIEDAGFVVRDMLHWCYGCLSDDTEILVDGRWEPYHKATTGKHALCYNVDSDTYEWQPIQELLTYDYRDTAYRIRSESTDQIVSRNHRCLVERDGKYTFRHAETLEHQARVPVLENLPELLATLPHPQPRTGGAQQSMRRGVRVGDHLGGAQGATAQGTAPIDLRGVRRGIHDALPSPRDQVLRATLQRQGAGEESDPVLGERQRKTQPEEGIARCQESGMEGRRDLFSQEGQLRADQVRALPGGTLADGAQGWVRDGASPDRGAGDRSLPLAVGGGTPRGSRSGEQCASEPDAFRDEPGSQTVRASRFTRADLATVTPEWYEGVVWCVRVPSGAFVARRNGQVFVTGNSGFPKRHDISKAFDRVEGNERGKVKIVGAHNNKGSADTRPYIERAKEAGYHEVDDDRLIGANAQAWHGWDVALKPGHEPIVLAQKPREGTYTANIERWGVGALNIAKCRIPTGDRMHKPGPNGGVLGDDETQNEFEQASEGRYPPNMLMTHSIFCTPIGCDPICPIGRVDKQSGKTKSSGGKRGEKFSNNAAHNWGIGSAQPANVGGLGDSGGASRYFPILNWSDDDYWWHSYTPKPASKEKNAGTIDPDTGDGGNTHVTIKPLAVMGWLLDLVLPKGQTALDPFAGSFTTLCAARQRGYPCDGIDLLAEHCEIGQARLSANTINRWED